MCFDLAWYHIVYYKVHEFERGSNVQLMKSCAIIYHDSTYVDL